MKDENETNGGDRKMLLVARRGCVGVFREKKQKRSAQIRCVVNRRHHKHLLLFHVRCKEEAGFEPCFQNINTNIEEYPGATLKSGEQRTSYTFEAHKCFTNSAKAIEPNIPSKANDGEARRLA